MGRRTSNDTTDVFRLKKIGLYYDETVVNFEGPYQTLGAAKARTSWSRGYNKVVIQQLVAQNCMIAGTTVLNDGTKPFILGAELVWKDIETFEKDGNE